MSAAHMGMRRKAVTVRLSRDSAASLERLLRKAGAMQALRKEASVEDRMDRDVLNEVVRQIKEQVPR